jgi:hypothetical protein
MNLDAAHAQPPAQRIDFHFRVLLDSSGDKRSGHHCAKPLHHKSAVNREPKGKLFRFGSHLQCQAPQLVLESFETLAGLGAHRKHR